MKNIIMNYGEENIRRPSKSGILVDENGDEVVCNNITSSKEFEEVFGKEAASMFRTPKSKRNGITVTHDTESIRKIETKPETEETEDSGEDIIEGNPIEE